MGVSPLTSRGGRDYRWEFPTKSLPISIKLGVGMCGSFFSALQQWHGLWVKMSLNHTLTLHSTIVGEGCGVGESFLSSL